MTIDSNCPPLALTPAAIRAAVAHLAEDGDEGDCFRVIALPTGFGWPHYALDTDKEKEGDVALTFPGLTVVIDPASAELLPGVVIDWVPAENGFQFIRPK